MLGKSRGHTPAPREETVGEQILPSRDTTKKNPDRILDRDSPKPALVCNRVYLP